MDQADSQAKEKSWANSVRSLGFKGAVVAFLKENVKKIENRDRLKASIERLRKYEPDSTIVNLLLRNPYWKSAINKLVEELPHTNAQPEVLFVFRGGGNVPTIPATDSKRVYFTSGQTLYSIDAVTGQVVWRKKSRRWTWHQVFLHGDTLYAASGKTLYALNKHNSRLLWLFRSEKHLTAPFATHQQVFIGSYEGTLYAIESNSGEKLWTFNVSRRIDVANGFWDNSICAVSEDMHLYSVRTDDGECRWRFPVASKVGSIPMVKKGLVVFGAENHKIYALLASSGKLFWEFCTRGKVWATPCISEDRVYCGSRDGKLYALDLETGKSIWHFKALGYVSSPAVEGEMVYFSTPGRIYAVSTEDYKMRWCFPLGFSVATSPVVEGRKLYSGTIGGQLVCLELAENLDEQGAARVLKTFLQHN